MTTRITGAVSGLDTDSLVKSEMQPLQTKLDTLNQTKQTVTWQRDAYKEMNAKILDFRNNKLTTFKTDTVLRARKAEVTGDTDAVKVTTNGGAATGSMTIKAMQLATGAALKSSNSIVKSGSTLDTKSTLTSQQAKLQGGSSMQSTYTFSVNGTSITVDTAKDSLSDVISRINKQTNVTAYYDSGTGNMSFTSKDAGDTSKVEITNDSKDFFKNILQTDTSTDTATNTQYSKGQNAIVEINGIKTTRTSNTFTENGINVTLNKVSELTDSTQAGSTDPQYYQASTITVTPDSDSIVSAIKDFVTQYNDVLKTLEDKVDETRYRDYKPLTSDQQEAMNETQINQWNEKAMSGLLRNDSILTSAVNKMRNAASSIVGTGSKYNTLASIGITAGDYTEKGKLYVDEDKLKAAIEANPDSVADIFSQKASSTSTNVTDNGFATRMYDDLYNTMKDLSTRAGTSAFSASTLKSDSTLGKQLSNLETQIDDQEDKMNDYEDRLYLKYSRMESALSTLQSQSSALTSLK
ncbi:flagellar filament capping protein FliD [Paenibacillus hexagrammi]|uniref:Flagellar hook-associated protein 2 n=1 Tax=Paenibacillus hexagrammi TaxID=2908839 RepID=A0ABY3SGT1_9BACL|nr:flagellar filament capping protein FliD [Paenibacillus sp. YPD9-1]UJF33194.1 flagellar filament capping protein FliD [Paenibacillus sp. YPD9-1]